MAARRVSARTTAIGLAATTCLTPFALAPTAAAAATSLCGPPADTVAPELANVTVSPSTIDLNSGPRTVTVTANATDTSGDGTPSGVRSVYVFLEGHDAGARLRLHLSAGDTTDGTYTGSYTLPKYAGPGALSLMQAFVTDHARNANSYDNFGSQPRDPNSITLQSGWQPTVTVTGTAPPKPVRRTAGRLVGFGFSPTTANAEKAPKNVQLHATFHGRQPERVFVYFQSAHGRRELRSRASLKRSGTQWHGHVRIGRWLGDHSYRPNLEAYFGSNAKPSGRHYQSDLIKNTFFADPLTVVSGTDKTRPTLQGLTITPASVDTTPGAQTVTVRATAVDAGSGVDRVNVSFGTSTGNAAGGSVAGFYPYPGIGYSREGGLDVTLHHLSGNTWTGTGTFRECEPSGTWRINVELSDRAGNGNYYRPSALAKAGLPKSIEVTSTPGDIVAPYVYGATASGERQTITLDFSEGVKNVSSSTLTVFAMRPVATRYQHPTAVTGVTCSNGSSTVACDGSDGLITSADLDVPDLHGKVGNKYEIYANQDGITSQLTDGIGNPMACDYAATVVTDS